MPKISVGLLTILTIALLMGCAGNSGPVFPGYEPDSLNIQNGIQEPVQSRFLWGFWEISTDKNTLECEIVPVRSCGLHINALRFLEPKSGGSTIGISGLGIDGTELTCDITLKHPFPGMNQFAGFDVRGILISDGSVSGFTDPDITLAGPGETRLLNRDGYTRWWNPVEFFNNTTMFAYRDGKLGVPYSTGNYGATLNGYKAFADALDVNDYIEYLIFTGLPPTQRRAVFSPGQANMRQYIIDFEDNGAGKPKIVFNYAVDASWEPIQPPPTILPDGCPLNSNCPEPFIVVIVETSNTLYRTPGGQSGGSIGLNINVFDWQGYLEAGNDVSKEVANVFVESPTCFTGQVAASVVPGSGAGTAYSTWHVDINGNPQSNDDQLFLITAVSANGDWQQSFTGFTGTAPLAAYQTATASVGTEPPTTSTLHLIKPNGGEKYIAGCPTAIEWESDGAPIANVRLEYSTDGFVSQIFQIVSSTPNDGEYGWEVPDISSDTVRVRVSDSLQSGVYDISDGDFEIGSGGPAIWPTMKYDYQRMGISPYNGPTTNNLLWATDIAGEMTPAPCIGYDGTIYVGTNDGRLVAVWPDGEIRWELSLGAYVLGSVSITDEGRLYVGSWGATGYLYAIECEGDIVWQFDCGVVINHSTPAIADDGTVYIGNNQGRFYAINPDGTEKWHVQLSPGFTPSPSIGPDGSIYVTTTGGRAYGITDNGQGSYTIFWNHFFGDHLGCPPAVDKNNVVYIAGLYQTNIQAWNPFTDTLLWTGHFNGSLGCGESSATVGPNGRVYIGCGDKNVYAFDPPTSGNTATIAWTFATGAWVDAAPILDPEGRIYVPSRDGYIYCLDSSNGSLIWKYFCNPVNLVKVFIRSEVAISNDGTCYVSGHSGFLRAFRNQ